MRFCSGRNAAIAASSAIFLVSVPLFTCSHRTPLPFSLPCSWQLRSNHSTNNNKTNTTNTNININNKGSYMTHCASAAEADGSKDIGDTAWRAKLTPQEYHILREKGTDPRFMALTDHFEPGEYHCAGCGSLLYTSAMKFHCGCGWPAFSDCVPLAVREAADADGRRTEILCNACGGHLGHIFRGEGWGRSEADERHCVNSTSLRFHRAE
ncbi:putative methionine sulfoxide reductase [Trypanosoma theileri]|uniref:Putative methionine sulfoxide reductase n=1 Tax=Trypanosoma theileri TaxID=67003 RepID=A0A1X0NSA2_9TRYP|nr:putative methionine sulfoxide reductase [Trypanosoma theileri]ORC87000.1 putative methionine sulfoxide reductase [Trypanosoma theileri]